jgi:hypothetical protein
MYVKLCAITDTKSKIIIKDHSVNIFVNGVGPDGFVIYKKGCTRLAAASDKVYQLIAHDRWFSPASSTTKTGRHDIAEILQSCHLITNLADILLAYRLISNLSEILLACRLKEMRRQVSSISAKLEM